MVKIIVAAQDKTSDSSQTREKCGLYLWEWDAPTEKEQPDLRFLIGGGGERANTYRTPRKVRWLGESLFVLTQAELVRIDSTSLNRLGEIKEIHLDQYNHRYPFNSMPEINSPESVGKLKLSDTQGDVALCSTGSDSALYLGVFRERKLEWRVEEGNLMCITAGKECLSSLPEEAVKRVNEVKISGSMKVFEEEIYFPNKKTLQRYHPGTGEPESLIYCTDNITAWDVFSDSSSEKRIIAAADAGRRFYLKFGDYWKSYPDERNPNDINDFSVLPFEATAVSLADDYLLLGLNEGMLRVFRMDKGSRKIKHVTDHNLLTLEDCLLSLKAGNSATEKKGDESIENEREPTGKNETGKDNSIKDILYYRRGLEKWVFLVLRDTLFRIPLDELSREGGSNIDYHRWKYRYKTPHRITSYCLMP